MLKNLPSVQKANKKAIQTRIAYAESLGLTHVQALSCRSFSMKVIKQKVESGYFETKKKESKQTLPYFLMPKNK